MRFLYSFLSNHFQTIFYSRIPLENFEYELNNSSSSPSLSSSSSSSFLEIISFLKPYYWPNNSKDKLKCLLTWLMVLLSKISNIISPLFLSLATNLIINNNNYKLACFNLILYGLLRILTLFFQEMQSFIYLNVKQNANVLISAQSFSHIQSLSFNWHCSKKTGSVLRILDRGGSACDNIVSQIFLSLIPGILESISVFIIFIWRFERRISFTVFIGIILYIFCTRNITVQRKRFRIDSNKQDNRYHQIASDTITNFELVKTFSTEQYETDRYADAVNQYQLSLRNIQSATTFLRIIQAVIINTTLLCNLLLTFQSVSRGTATIGDFLAVSAYTINVFSPLNALGGIFNSIIQCLADVDNLLSLLSLSPEVVDSDDAIPLQLNLNNDKLSHNFNDQKINHSFSVEFDDVCFNYPDQPEEHGLQHISIFLPAGTTTAIVGSTGSGKTTLSRLLYRFYDPKSGVIRIGGHDIKKYTQLSVRKYIGIVPQDTVLFNETLLYNIKYGRPDATFDEVNEAAEFAQIKQFIEGLPNKWETQVGERGLRLSGGEKQRVAIARCFLQDPPIVILDEATAALDTATEKSIQDALSNLRKYRTVLIIAHRLTTIKNADNIVVLDHGKIVESGTHEKLIEKGGIYSNLWLNSESEHIATKQSKHFK